ncbi:hypothetical protein SAMN05444156_3253 [Verrucomicrobium sp. GAS474]|uniref:hypothetical protein n=1 Tax=Verrucomicrobium sp. GAS474 TaxID=1882831 RepID=UPI0008797324|nr:hypothetical protein [Verrucomicrobium sp. GAS474]SDT85673.1 hypothetical protein SAMN05444156_0015 [Verrucomicrobium sp. GAS474]SDU31638.1 hypothetical protein SAMN05444156_3253 [Verrucomicrobium sp. GAS474]
MADIYAAVHVRVTCKPDDIADVKAAEAAVLRFVEIGLDHVRDTHPLVLDARVRGVEVEEDRSDFDKVDRHPQGTEPENRR